MADIEHEAALEAVTTLRLLLPQAVPTIAGLMTPLTFDHPRAIATRYRKGGEQLDDAEKKALGIRRNGFLSKLALAEIAPLGLEQPLIAHETTLLRATFTVMRHRRVEEGEKARKQFGKGFLGYEHIALHRECPACNLLHGRITDAENASVMPPPECVPGCYANYDIRLKIDFLAELDF